MSESPIDQVVAQGQAALQRGDRAGAYGLLIRAGTELLDSDDEAWRERAAELLGQLCIDLVYSNQPLDDLSGVAAGELAAKLVPRRTPTYALALQQCGRAAEARAVLDAYQPEPSVRVAYTMVEAKVAVDEVLQRHFLLDDGVTVDARNATPAAVSQLDAALKRAEPILRSPEVLAQFGDSAEFLIQRGGFLDAARTMALYGEAAGITPLVGTGGHKAAERCLACGEPMPFDVDFCPACSHKRGQPPPPKVPKRFPWEKVLIAALIVILIGLAFYAYSLM